VQLIQEQVRETILTSKIGVGYQLTRARDFLCIINGIHSADTFQKNGVLKFNSDEDIISSPKIK